MASREEERQAQRLRVAAALALLVLLLIGGVAAVVAGTGDDGARGAAAALPDIPDQRRTRLADAARAAGCRRESFPKRYEALFEVPESRKIEYETNPPAFGPHVAEPALDGNYVGQGTPPAADLVHSLAHGRIQIQYRPGLPRPQVRRLEALFEEKPEVLLLFENDTGAPGDVTVTAWTHILRCPEFSRETFDAIRTFRDAHRLKGPEALPGSG